MNDKGLCNIICQNGEGCLCEICSEHPRFYNFFSDHTEAGLGLSCEEAARIILSEDSPIMLSELSDDGYDDEWENSENEEYILQKRQQIFEIIKSRTRSLDKRVGDILKLCSTTIPQKTPSEWSEIFTNLEILDPNWKDLLKSLSFFGSYDPISEFDIPFENLLHYFVYRHASSAESKEDFSDRVAFAVMCYTMIKALCNAAKTQKGSCTFSDLCEFARIFSAEIEYSEENTKKLIYICHQAKLHY